jgi:predicted HTH domain antitoxin
MKTIKVRVPEALTEKDVKLATAIEAFNRKIVSINRAAEIAETPIQEFILELKRRGIPAYPIPDDEARKELEI